MADLIKNTLTIAMDRGLKIATAESCTGGLIAAALTEMSGSSAVFERGFVTYSNEAKVEMLGIMPSTLDDFGAVSEQIAIEMASGALIRSDADFAVSVTGIAGPGGSEHKPEGRVCFGLAQSNAETLSQTIEFGAIGRGQVRAKTVEHALTMLITALLK